MLTKGSSVFYCLPSARFRGFSVMWLFEFLAALVLYRTDDMEQIEGKLEISLITFP